MPVNLWAEISGKALRPRLDRERDFSLPSGLEDEPTRETDEPPNWESLTPIAGVPCIIFYTDGNGNESERLITCQRLDDHAGELYLWAYCHSRSAVRQFKFSRIGEVSDAATGETFFNKSDFFGRFAADNSHASQPGWGLSVVKKADFTALLNALVFIARCDREYHPLERESLEAVITGFWIRNEVLHEPDINSILTYADRLAPDAEVFWIAIHRCAKDSKLLSLLVNSTRSVIDADGSISDEEFYWGRKVDEFVKQLAIS